MGREMMLAVMSLLAIQQIQHISLCASNDRMGFFESMGYQKVERHEIPPTGHAKKGRDGKVRIETGLVECRIHKYDNATSMHCDVTQLMPNHSAWNKAKQVIKKESLLWDRVWLFSPKKFDWLQADVLEVSEMCCRVVILGEDYGHFILANSPRMISQKTNPLPPAKLRPPLEQGWLTYLSFLSEATCYISFRFQFSQSSLFFRI
mgnify:CR=1 FL=1